MVVWFIFISQKTRRRSKKRLISTDEVGILQTYYSLFFYFHFFCRDLFVSVFFKPSVVYILRFLDFLLKSFECWKYCGRLNLCVVFIYRSWPLFFSCSCQQDSIRKIKLSKHLSDLVAYTKSSAFKGLDLDENGM